MTTMKPEVQNDTQIFRILPLSDTHVAHSIHEPPQPIHDILEGVAQLLKGWGQYTCFTLGHLFLKPKI